MAEVDRRILARIRGCQDTTFLEGAACTNRCEHFKDCEIKRTPLVIYTLKARVNLEGNATDEGIFVSQFSVEQSQQDGWINEIFERNEKLG